MALDTGNYLRIRLKQLYAGEFCYANMEYYPLGAALTINDLPGALDDWVDQVLPNINAIQTDSVVNIEVSVQRRGINSNNSDISAALAGGGVLDDHTLPVYNTWSFEKVPDNDTVAPVNDYVFRNGRVCFSGVPETWQDDGIANPVELVNLATTANALHSFTLTGDGAPVMYMRMDNRKPGGTGLRRAVHVAYVTFNRLGTQLTRKR